MGEERIVRKMLFEDIEGLSNAFVEQGWSERKDILNKYFLEQEVGERQVLVALVGRFLAGYITVIPLANHGPFAGLYPELTDFNVFERCLIHIRFPNKNIIIPFYHTFLPLLAEILPKNDIIVHNLS